MTKTIEPSQLKDTNPKAFRALARLWSEVGRESELSAAKDLINNAMGDYRVTIPNANGDFSFHAGDSDQSYEILGREYLNPSKPPSTTSKPSLRSWKGKPWDVVSPQEFFKKYFVDREEVNGEKVGVWEFPNNALGAKLQKKFLDEIGGLPHPYGGYRCIVSGSLFNCL